MLISEAIEQANVLTGQSLPVEALVRWLSEMDGRLAFEFYRAEGWLPYDPVDDLETELLVPFPWDGMYVHHLEAMTYFTNAEYDRYENARTLSEKTLADFRAFMQRTQAKLCGGGFPTEKTGGTYTTVIPEQAQSPWFWVNAYSLAVQHGFAGTEDEWLESLVGPKGDKGDPYTILGLYPTLAALEAAHPTGEAGDAYAVGDEDENTTYNWDVDAEAWVNIGPFRGPQGETGETGATGAAAGFGTVSATVDGNTGTPGVNVLTSGPDTAKNITFEFVNLKGETGATGADGEDGISPEVTIAEITGGHSVSITDADHPSGQTFNVMDGIDGAPGQDGQDGAPGVDGVSPEVTIDTITGGHSVTITDADHPSGQSFNVMDGEDGADGDDGVSPGVSVSTITGGHTVTITDAEHPSGQSFDVMDGADGTSFVIKGLYATLADLILAHPTGSAGDAYAVGTSSSNTTYIWDVDENDWTNIGFIQGPPGQDGQDGHDGAPGQNGQDGAAGADGVSPGVSISNITGGHTVTITDRDHPNGQSFNVMDGADGAPGQNGQDGAPGPNQVTNSTATNINGLLKGNGSTVEAATAGTDYQAPLVAGTDYATPAMIPSVPSAYTSNPAMDGTASPGSSANYARGDHVHPSDTSKAFKTDLTIVSTTGSTNNSGSVIPAGMYFYKDGALARALVDIVTNATLVFGTNYTSAAAIGALNDINNTRAMKSDLTSIYVEGSSNNTGSTITSGTYFYLNNALVVAKTDIANGATFTNGTNYESPTAGGLNALKSAFGKVLYTSNTPFTSGNVSIPGISNYKFAIFIMSNDTPLLCTINNPGGLIVGGVVALNYNSNTLVSAGCNYAYDSSVEQISINDQRRGFGNGSNSNYSGYDVGFVRVIGIV